jgi:hypothetical protein
VVEPPITPSVEPVKNGVVTILVPAIGPYDAYGFTLTPSA